MPDHIKGKVQTYVFPMISKDEGEFVQELHSLPYPSENKLPRELHCQGVVPIERDEGYYHAKLYEEWHIIFWSAELSMWLVNEPSVISEVPEPYGEIDSDSIKEIDPERIVRKHPKH